MSDLTRGGVFGPRPDPHPELLALETTRDPQAVPDGPATVPVFVTNAVRTSDGPGPGVKHLPPAEANRLISARYAVGGESPPRGFDDGGASGQAVGLMMPRTERR
ncbi:MAG TPA: hypothetical protein VFQ68_01655 [Streptosporangiaceae bacterium]|nr:hypothetical protein [Streptosporangiaceae bacterium]